MSKHQFSTRERYALWMAYDKKCTYCREPVRFAAVAVDHIIPEWLIGEPDRLALVWQELDLPADFDLNDFANWACAHTSCNCLKGGTIFGKGAASYYLQRARALLPKVRAYSERYSKEQKADDLLASLERGIEAKLIEQEDLRRLIAAFGKDAPSVGPSSQEPLLTVDEVVTVSAAFEWEMQRLLASHSITGIKLAYLAKKAIEEEGDFKLAEEAFFYLIRLGTARIERGYGGSVISPLPCANPCTSALNVLRYCRRDYGLVASVLHRARFFALIGDAPFGELSQPDSIPHKSILVLVDVLGCAALDAVADGAKWFVDMVARELAMILLSVGFALDRKGIAIPDPPTQRWIAGDGQRWVADGQDPALLPVVRLGDVIGRLPQPAFDQAVAAINYRVDVDPIKVDKGKGDEEANAMHWISAWSVVPRSALTWLAVKDEPARLRCQVAVDAATEQGKRVAHRLRAYLQAERELIWKPRPPATPAGG